MNPRLLSSVYGEIREVLIVLPGIPTPESYAEYQAITDCFCQKGIVNRFQQDAQAISIRVVPIPYGDGPRVDSCISIQEQVEDIVATIDHRELLRRWRRELEELMEVGPECECPKTAKSPLGKRLRYRRWAQDPFLTLQAGDAIVLLQSHYTHSLADLLLPHQIVGRPEKSIYLKTTRLYLEGGNLLCSRNHAFIGADLVDHNVALHGWDEGRVLEEFRQALGISKISVVGYPILRRRWQPQPEDPGTRQPLFHIDLFLTLGGVEDETGREKVWLASARRTCEVMQENAGPGIKMPPQDDDLLTRLEEIRDCFPEEAFHSILLPIYWRNGTIYSWNNCLVEVTDASRIAYLPTYQCAIDEERLNPTFRVLEIEVERRFEEGGFKVVWIRSGLFFRIIASHGGSLHCVTKVLRRGD